MILHALSLTLIQNSVTETYFSREDHPNCLILWVLALAFQDDVFEHYKTPNELFNLLNPTEETKEILIKKDWAQTPLLRRMEPCGRKVSATLPYTYGSYLNATKRIAKGAGYTERFTPYTIRRGVLNASFNGRLLCV